MENALARSIAMMSVALLALTLSGCSGEFGSAMEKGCDGLRSASAAYAAGDRETFETVIHDAMSLGGAVELSDAEGTQQQDEAGAAFTGAKALHTAAYEGVEYNDGRKVWQGKPLDPDRKQQLEQGLAACENLLSWRTLLGQFRRRLS